MKRFTNIIFQLHQIVNTLSGMLQSSLVGHYNKGRSLIKVVLVMMIPVVRQHWCKILMLDATESLAFYGKVKDQAAFERMLKGMRSVNPELQIGHTAENVELYKQRVMLYKAAKDA